MRRLPRIAPVALVMLVAAATPASAYFEDVVFDARSESMGASTIASVRGPGAAHWNPAGLAWLERPELLLDYSKPYAVPDLNSSAIAIAARRWNVGWTIAWHRLGVAGVYSEDLLTLAAGRALMLPFEGHSLGAGASFKWGRVGFSPFEDERTGATADYGSSAKGSGDLALHWNTPWRMSAAWVWRDVARPRYRVIPGSDGGLVPSRHDLALAYRWNRESVITAGWTQLDETGATTLNAGLEIEFFGVFAVRSGLSNVATIYRSFDSPTQFQFTGGFGVDHRGWTIDAATVTNRDLGQRYRVTLIAPLGGEPR